MLYYFNLFFNLNIHAFSAGRLESRMKKPSEGRASVKKGRRPRKRSQETNKRKFSKTSRNHGG